MGDDAPVVCHMTGEPVGLDAWYDNGPCWCGNCRVWMVRQLDGVFDTKFARRWDVKSLGGDSE